MIYRIKAESKKWKCLTTDETDCAKQAWKRAMEWLDKPFFYGYVTFDHQAAVEADIVSILDEQHLPIIKWERQDNNQMILTYIKVPFNMD